MGKNVRYALVTLAVILVWLLSGMIVGDRSESREQESIQQSGRQSTLVEVRRSQAVPFQPITRFNARTEPYRSVNLRPETSGLLIKVHVEKGRQVEAGELIAQLAIEDRQLRVNEAEAVLEQVRLEYDAALDLKGKGLLSEAETARRNSAVESALADVESRRLELSRTEIRAPFAGILNDRLEDQGDFLQRGQSFATLLQLDPLKVVFEVSEQEVVDIDPALPIGFQRVDGQWLQGTFYYRSAQANKSNRTFRVEALIANPDHQILADLSGTVRIRRKQQQAHSVPAAILSLNTQGELVVKALDSNRRVVAYPVQILADDADSVWVSGLPTDIQIIVRGFDYVGVGEQVRLHSTTDSTEPPQ